MECPSCTFQNTPGTNACVRCGTVLDLRAVDFIPPRASQSAVVRGVHAAGGTLWLRALAAVEKAGQEIRLPETLTPEVRTSRSAIPSPFTAFRGGSCRLHPFSPHYS